MQITPATIAGLQAGFNKQFQKAFDKAESFSEPLVTLVPVTSKKEVFGFMDRIPKMRKSVGERQFENLVSRAVEIEVDKYFGDIEVDADDIEDDNLGIYASRIDMMGMQAKKWPDQLFIEAVQAGATKLAYDGQYFFDTDHPVNMDDPASAVQANKFTSKSLTKANYAEVRATMMSYKGVDGQPLGVRPNLLVVPPALEDAGRTILNAEFIAQGETNTMKGTADLLVIPELANEATTWYLLATSWPIRPFVFVRRSVPVMRSLDASSEHLILKDKYVLSTKARGAVGYGPWFLAAKATA